MATPQEMLDAYTAAELAVLEGKSVEVGGRKLSLENLQEIRAGRTEWERRVNAAAAPAVPRFGGLRYSVADFSGRDQ